MSKGTFRKKRGNKTRRKSQRLYNMKGCSKTRRMNSRSKKLTSRQQKLTSRELTSRELTGGQGCGAYGCPLAPFSWKQMQQRGGTCNTGVTCGAPILGTAQTGGTCTSCGMQGVMQGVMKEGLKGGLKGGSFYKPAAPIPGPFVGQSWTPGISGWPGVNGVGSDRNYIANNLYDNGDPQTMMKLGGSKKIHSKRNKGRGKGKRGGGLIPQDLVNLGRDASFNLKSAYNSLNGYAAPANPLPYKDQLNASVFSNKIII